MVAGRADAGCGGDRGRAVVDAVGRTDLFNVRVSRIQRLLTTFRIRAARLVRPADRRHPRVDLRQLSTSSEAVRGAVVSDDCAATR